MTYRPERALRARLKSYCHAKFESALTADQSVRLERYVLGLVDEGVHAPMIGRAIAWADIATATDIPLPTVRDLSPLLRPAFDVIVRAFPQSRPRDRQTQPTKRIRKPVPSVQARATPPKAPPQKFSAIKPATVKPPKLVRVAKPIFAVEPPASPAPAKRGPKLRPIVEFPEPKTTHWIDVPGFAAALDLHMTRHGDTAWSLHRAIVRSSEPFNRTTLKSWRLGSREPRSLASREMLARIEHRYRLLPGYFNAKLAHPSRAATGYTVAKISEQRRLAWHLPNDFEARPATEQAEILDWVQSVIVSGSTDYRRYQAAAAKHRFGLRFPTVRQGRHGRDATARAPSPLDAPPTLAREMAELLTFKTAPLTALGYQRNGIWGSETAAQKVEHLSLMFGALAANPHSAAKGLGVPVESLSFAHLLFPAVWDWYLRWRYKRRGFYTAWELDMLIVAQSLVRKDYGWIRQSPALADQLCPIPGLVSEADVALAREDWLAACDRLFEYARATSREVKKISKVHRDPFEPILAVLEADSPLREYRKITDEIVRLMPCERQYQRQPPKPCAHS